MTSAISRTYRLQLSRDGLLCFLDCHARLARLACDFIPYGMTLNVAITLLDRLDDAEVAAELASPASARMAGDIVRFVGFSPRLADLMTQIVLRMERSLEMGVRPTRARLAMAGLSCFLSADEQELALAYARAYEAKNVSRIINGTK